MIALYLAGRIIGRAFISELFGLHAVLFHLTFFIAWLTSDGRFNALKAIACTVLLATSLHLYQDACVFIEECRLAAIERAEHRGLDL